MIPAWELPFPEMGGVAHQVKNLSRLRYTHIQDLTPIGSVVSKSIRVRQTYGEKFIFRCMFGKKLSHLDDYKISKWTKKRMTKFKSKKCKSVLINICFRQSRACLSLMKIFDKSSSLHLRITTFSCVYSNWFWKCFRQPLEVFLIVYCVFHQTFLEKLLLLSWWIPRLKWKSLK